MAVIRTRPTRSTRHDELVRRLAAELRQQQRTQQPFVYVNDVAQTGTLHVTVVWDEWRDLTIHERAQVILDAFAEHDRTTVGHITIAIGVTGEEARRLGLLPYRVQLLLRRGEEPQRSRLEELLRQEGAFDTPEGLQLLFRSEQQAEDAYRRLQSAAPQAPWALVREETN